MDDAPRSIPADQWSLLRRCGLGAIEHSSGVPYLGHLTGVRRILLGWDARPALLDAGLFHSLYGTEFFDPRLAGPPARDELRSCVGTEAERLVWLWCEGRREGIAAALDSPAPRLPLRSGDTEEVGEQELRDLAELWCADCVEQLPRLAPDASDLGPALAAAASIASAAARRALEPHLGPLAERRVRGGAR